MLVAASPTKFGFAWAYSAVSPYIRAIPQTTATPGAASLALGYPPVTFQPVGSGGIPPDGQDENGILNQVTLWLQWMNAGGPIYYDATFSGDVGGYPLGSVLSNASTQGLFWVSTVDGNTTDPDTGGAGWQAFPTFQTAATAADVQAGATGPNALTRAVVPASLALACGTLALTDAATVAWDTARGFDAELIFTSAVGSTRVIGAPTNLNDGQTYALDLVQAATGGPYATTWNAIFNFGANGAPTLSTGAGKRDSLLFQYRGGAVNTLKFLGIALGF